MSKNSKSVIRSQKRKKIFAIEYLGGKCQMCGYNKCPAALHFHHINSKTKKYNPSRNVIRWSWERVKPEIDKCILICANCHAEIHYNNIDLSVVLRKMEKIKKICNHCNNEYYTYNKNQKYCGYKCYQLSRKNKNMPTKEILWKLLQEGNSFVSIGKMFDVSDNGIRKWCKHYKLPHRKKDIKK